MNRRTVIAAVLCASLAGAVFGDPAAARTRRAPVAQGRVVKAVDLTINGRPAAVGALVRAGDRLRTGSGGVADVVLADGAIFRLYPASEARVPAISRKKSFVQLVVGGLMSLVGKPMDYQVKAPKVVAAVGGTCFYLQATPEAPNYICACSGLVHMGATHRAMTPVDAGFNKHIGVMIGAVGFSPAGAKNHDDNQMWELGRELQEATGIPNKYRALHSDAGRPVEVAPPAEAPPPALEVAPPPAETP
ncbi:MAG: FecR domain-containing protein [Candidatus Sericytochromatia bacterium]|nr:FecR domain-containing protein [Candidatus Tanganyikabacteria bacterium]